MKSNREIFISKNDPPILPHGLMGGFYKNMISNQDNKNKYNKEYCRKWRIKNHEHYLEYCREYYKNHKARRSEIQMKWYWQNREARLLKMKEYKKRIKI